MKVLNFGSLNIDHVYQVDHFVRPGETILSKEYQLFFGGKGFNQSVALARAGANVYHAGKVGDDGKSLLKECEKLHIKTDFIEVDSTPSGHAIIQVDPSGENCILLYGGANQSIDSVYIDKILENFSEGDYLLIQNEISSTDYLITQAHKKGLKIVFNPAPMNEKVFAYPLELIDLFILNETEAFELSNEINVEQAIWNLKQKYSRAEIIITQGGKGVSFLQNNELKRVKALTVEVIDTTAAGDTFVGYFLSSLIKNESLEEAITLGNKAASLAVQKSGASGSIPEISEII
ncbi:MAG: ribokinase [Planctomycetota bacterium]|nr:MAG: ribokinase [Planctomycetota bacterium]